MPSHASRIPIVGVMGSGGSDGGSRAIEAGRLIARLGVHLLTGGGPGTMESVSRAFVEVRPRTGLAIGVIPSAGGAGDVTRPKDGYPSAWVEIVIQTHLPRSGRAGTDAMSRNHINVLSSDFIIALAGGDGTASEVELARRYRKPVVAFIDTRADIPRLPSDVAVITTLRALETEIRSVLGLSSSSNAS